MKNDPFVFKTARYIKKWDIKPEYKKILVAVSGGVDSMVLADVLLKLGFYIEIAHVNFHLRDIESDEDEKFISEYFNNLNIKTNIFHADTKEYIALTRQSLQEGARKIRYDWFNNLLIENNIQTCALAHHLDDSIETAFYNLLRSKEYRLLNGITPQTGKFIRPILWAKKSEIYHYASKNNIPFREDRTNKSNDYLRNYIRNEILPLVEKINPDYRNQLADKISLYSDQYKLHLSVISQLADGILEVHFNYFIINVDLLKKNKPGDWKIIWRFLLTEKIGTDFDFQSAAFELIESESGKRIESLEFFAYKEQSKIIILDRINLDYFVKTPLQNVFEYNIDYNKLFPKIVLGEKKILLKKSINQSFELKNGELTLGIPHFEDQILMKITLLEITLPYNRLRNFIEEKGWQINFQSLNIEIYRESKILCKWVF